MYIYLYIYSVYKILVLCLLQESLGKDEGKLLTLEGFLLYVVDKARQDIRAIWRALLACGFDLHFERFASFLSKRYEKHGSFISKNMKMSYTDYGSIMTISRTERIFLCKEYN